jgi:hypothetical protein
LAKAGVLDPENPYNDLIHKYLIINTPPYELQQKLDEVEQQILRKRSVLFTQETKVKDEDDDDEELIIERKRINRGILEDVEIRKATNERKRLTHEQEERKKELKELAQLVRKRKEVFDDLELKSYITGRKQILKEQEERKKELREIKRKPDVEKTFRSVFDWNRYKAAASQEGKIADLIENFTLETGVSFSGLSEEKTSVLCDFLDTQIKKWMDTTPNYIKYYVVFMFSDGTEKY